MKTELTIKEVSNILKVIASQQGKGSSKRKVLLLAALLNPEMEVTPEEVKTLEILLQGVF